MAPEDYQDLLALLAAYACGQDAARLDRIVFRHATVKAFDRLAHEVIEAVVHDFARDRDAPAITRGDCARFKMGVRVSHVAAHPGLLSRCLAVAASDLHRNEGAGQLLERLMVEWTAQMQRLARHLSQTSY